MDFLRVDAMVFAPALAAASSEHQYTEHQALLQDEHHDTYHDK